VGSCRSVASLTVRVMKEFSGFKKMVISSWFLALIPALIIYIFLPQVGSKYSLIVEAGGSYKYEFCYEDLNSDSVSEFISIGKGIPF